MYRFLVFLSLILGAVVLAGTRPASEPRPVYAASQTFAYTGAEQTYQVPPGVTRLRIEVHGGNGGISGGCINNIAEIPYGGSIVGIIPVTPGATLFVNVGGNPQAGGVGGWNGGGNGGMDPVTGFHASGGAGATDVRTISRVQPASLASRLIVAGGTGGNGRCGQTGFWGVGASGLFNEPKGSDGGPGGGIGGASGSFGGAGGAAPFGQPGAPGIADVGGAGGNASGVIGPNGRGGAGGGGGGGAVGGGGAGSTNHDQNGRGGGGGGAGSTQILAPGGVQIGGASVLIGLDGEPSARITVLDPPAITKTFLPGAVALNGVTNLTLTLTNNNPTGNRITTPFSELTDINFTDNFAAQGLVITTGAVTGTPLCGGTITALAGTSSISLANGTLAAATSCQITVQVRATQGGSQINTTGAVSAAESGPGATASATLNVATVGPTLGKSFSPQGVQPGGTTTLTLVLTNPNPIPVTGLAFTDNFAALGMVITSAAPTGSPLCAGTLTAAPGTSLVSLTGGTLAANASCQIVVTVLANSVGSLTNITSPLTSNEFPPSTAATAPILVALATPTPTATLPAALTATPVAPVVQPQPFVMPVIPQVFQHVPQGIFTAPRSNTPTPVARTAVAPLVVAPAAPLVLRPPNTGDAGMLRPLKLPSAW